MTDNRKYFFGSISLVPVLSAFDYLFDLNYIKSEQLNQRYGTGFDKANFLGEWLLDEIDFATTLDGINEQESKTVYSQLEDMDSLTIEWANRLQNIADHIYQITLLDKEICLYYCGCAWSLRMLWEYQHLQESLTSAILAQRFATGKGRIKEFHDWLELELSFSITHVTSNKERRCEVNKIAKEILSQFVDEWFEQVNKLSF